MSGEPEQRVIGFVGRSGSGKTTLLSRLIPILNGWGHSVSTIKHTHHDFDMDQPGKDSYRHREAGAHEVLLTSTKRWALLHELRSQPEPTLDEAIKRMARVDILLIEGFKSHPYPKIEVYRASLGHSLMARDDPSIVAIASDGEFETSGAIKPRLALDDAVAVAAFVTRYLGLADDIT